MWTLQNICESVHTTFGNITPHVDYISINTKPLLIQITQHFCQSWACPCWCKGGHGHRPSCTKRDHGHAHARAKVAMGMPMLWQRWPWACPWYAKRDLGHAHDMQKGTLGMPMIWRIGPLSLPSDGHAHELHGQPRGIMGAAHDNIWACPKGCMGCPGQVKIHMGLPPGTWPLRAYLNRNML